MPASISRVIWIVLDGVGVGALPDAELYGDQGANTLRHISEHVPEIRLPNLRKKGLGNLVAMPGVPPHQEVQGAYGIMGESSPGKDSTTGHWELAGIILKRPFPIYPNGFPEDLIRKFERRIDRDVLGNVHASGTEIIEELGREHLASGKPILYTSADSVFQLAAHKEVIPLEELYDMCRVAREVLSGENAVSRVIARPFVGRPGSFERVGAERLDISLPPPRSTVLDLCRESGLTVKGIGKVGDIYAGRGFESSPHTTGNEETMRRILEEVSLEGKGIVMANLVDFDMLYGHRRDVQGFARALRECDLFIPELESRMAEEDVCVVVSDHGCDPTHSGSDHTREYAILLVFGKGIISACDLGIRGSFADCGKSIADFLGIDGSSLDGESFAEQITRHCRKHDL